MKAPRPMRLPSCLLAAAAIALAVPAAPAPAQSRILDVKTRVTVAAEDVLLRDLLQAPGLLDDALLSRRVLSAPQIGSPSRLSLVEVAYALQGIPELLQYHLRGPDFVAVERTVDASVLDGLMDRIRLRLQSLPPWRDWEIQVEFTLQDERRLQPMPPEGRVEVIPEDAQAWVGSVPIRVLFYTGAGDRLDECALAPIIRRRVDAVMAADVLQRGTVLSADDLRTSPMWVSDAHRDVMTDLDLCIGRELARDLAAGELVREQHVMEPVCAQRGEPVRVACRVAGLEVMMTGIAVERGRRGDRIRVRNPVSRKEILVDLTRPKHGEVVAGL